MIPVILAPILEVLSKAADIARPIITEHLAQKYEDETRSRLSEYQDISQIDDPEARRDAHRGYAMRLCLDTGFPVQEPLSGASIEVPVECYNAFVRGQIEAIRLRHLLAAASYALEQRGP